jgi:hypothetical protein
VDPEAGERLDEDAGEVAGVAGVAVARGIGDVGQRSAHLPLDGVRGEEGLGVHGIHVVDAVQEGGEQAALAEGAADDVEDDRAAEAPDVDGPGRRLRVVDDLRPLDRRGELVRPVHRCVLRSGCRRASRRRLPPGRVGPGAGGQLIDLIE